jgi:thiazole synthase
MNIKVNGQLRQFSSPLSITRLAEQLALNPTQVAIERNREIVPKSTYAQVQVNEGDEIEIVTFIGGG